MFTKYLKTATVKRQTYTTSGGYKKWSFASVGWVYQWHLRPATDKDGIELRAFGKDYIFTTAQTSNIMQWDKVTIDGIEYDCWGVSDYWGITFNKKKCILKLSDDWN
jgi:hypothetical protein